MTQYKESIIEKAARIAVKAHKDQLRKDGDLPYAIHPFMVAFLLQKHGFSDEIIAAALCHDVLEDTNYPEALLHNELGDKAYKIVKTVTYNYGLDWHDRMLGYIESVRRGSEGAKAVCVADKIHNLQSLLIAYGTQGPKFWNKFSKGKQDKIWFEESVLRMLKENWRHPMLAEFEQLIEKEKSLK